MRGFLAAVLVCAAAPGAWADPPKLVPLRVDGDTVLVVRSLPCTVTAPPGADFYLWECPPGVTAAPKDNVLTVTAAPAGQHRVLVTTITFDLPEGKKPEKRKEIGETTLQVGAVPGPRPQPDTKPDPKPAPAAPVKLKAVIVEETADLAAARSRFFGSAAVQARWKEKGHLPFVVVDKDTKDGATNATPPAVAPYIARARGKGLPQLYLVDSATGAVLYEGPAFDDPAAFLAILDKIGG